ncbi:MAG: glycosyltransferase family 2 protein [Chloroflexota bacterium]
MTMVSVVVPVYHNEGSLLPLYEKFTEIEAQLNARDITLQLIFVDDGSQDASFERLMEIKKKRPETTIVKLARNFGAVTASKTGLKFVEGDCFMWIAADLQDPPAVILEMVSHWKAGNKYVIVVRNQREDPPLSKLFSSIYYRLLRTFVMPNYPEGGFDLAMMDAQLLPYIRDSSKRINTPLLSYWLGFTPYIMTYDRQKRIHGKSQWSFIKRLNFMLDSLLGFSVLPLRFISFVGLIVSILSFLYGISVSVAAILGNVPVQGFATLVSLITFLLGLIIIMLGIIGEYIWRIFIQVNQRPEAVIDEVY